MIKFEPKGHLLLGHNIIFWHAYGKREEQGQNPDPPAFSFSTNHGPRANHGLFIDQSGAIADSFQIWQDLVRFGLENPANHRYPSRHVYQSHEGLQALTSAGDWV